MNALNNRFYVKFMQLEIGLLESNFTLGKCLFNFSINYIHLATLCSVRSEVQRACKANVPCKFISLPFLRFLPSG